MAAVPSYIGLTSIVFLPIALALSGGFVALAMRFHRERTPPLPAPFSSPRSSICRCFLGALVLTRRMNSAMDLAPTRAPHLVAAQWPGSYGLILISGPDCSGLFFLRQVEVTRLASHQLPDDGMVPPFQLVDQDNQSFGTEQLRGKIWIADFVYTSCPGPCPMISSRMAEMQKPLRDTDVRLVSFSVDPQHDTPALLRDYASKLSTQSGRWSFLTGDKETIYRLIQQRIQTRDAR